MWLVLVVYWITVPYFTKKAICKVISPLWGGPVSSVLFLVFRVSLFPQTTSGPASWVAWISSWLLVPGCLVNPSWGTLLLDLLVQSLMPLMCLCRHGRDHGCHGHCGHSKIFILYNNRSTRGGGASIGTIAVADTCGYTPPTNTFQSRIGSGQREMECCWEHWAGGDAEGHGVHQRASWNPDYQANSVRLTLPFLLMNFWHKRS